VSGSGQIKTPIAELSVVIPTFKERGNVAELVRRLDASLQGIAWEAIFVDDNSPDGTAAAVKEIAVRDPRVRCLRRVGRRGLAGACIEGMLSSAASYVAVIDADLQHDEKVLPAMLAKLRSGEADLVAATRYVAGGSAASFSEKRGAISQLATRLTHRLVGTKLSDPMSGFFMMRRDRFDEIVPRLSPAGFKILLDIAAGSKLRVAEQPYSFGERFEGESKFNIQIGVEFLGLLLAKIIATFVAMTSNFLLNNELTYRDRRLKGWGMLRGFVLFCLIASVGVLANVDLASWLYVERPIWWVAGAVGAVMSVLWNYAMSTLFVWRAR
jgi:dolichol-phosphate mannosyltransferase